jgi:hypothetical protein
MNLRLPLWARWIASLLLFGAVGAGLVAMTRDGDALYSRDPAAETEANRLARMVVAEDQKPQTAAWRRGTHARAQLERAITADVRGRVRRGQLGGRPRRVRCGIGGPPRRGRLRFSCTALVDSITYPFAGVADRRTRRLTWCKRNPAPDPAAEIPLDRRCTS